MVVLMSRWASSDSPLGKLITPGNKGPPQLLHEDEQKEGSDEWKPNHGRAFRR